jgi:hypothetical protein
MPSFEMLVLDVFWFSDGRTVFMGQVTTGPERITRSLCRLISDGVVLGEFEIEGEMMPKRTRAGAERSVSVAARVDVDRELIMTGTVRLIGGDGLGQPRD